MMSKIQSVIYTDEVKSDEDKIQGGSVTVNITKSALIKAAIPKLEQMWLNDELPAGDSRCRDAPPSERMILRPGCCKFFAHYIWKDIHFPKEEDQWWVCGTCWKQSISEEDRGSTAFFFYII